MTYYNMTTCSNVETFLQFMECPNTVTDGGFWMMMWVAVFFVTFLIAKNMRFENDHAFAGASVISFFSGIFLFWLGLIGWQVMLGSTVMLILAGVWLLVNSSVEY